MAQNYNLRVLIETDSGSKFSYETSSFNHTWTDSTGTRTIDDVPILNAHTVNLNINNMVSCSYIDSYNENLLKYKYDEWFGGNRYLGCRLNEKGWMSGSLQFYEKFSHENESEVAGQVSNFTNDGLTFHYDGADKASKGYLDDPNIGYDTSGNKKRINYTWSATRDYIQFTSSDAYPATTNNISTDLQQIYRSNESTWYMNENNLSLAGDYEVFGANDSFTIQFWCWSENSANDYNYILCNGNNTSFLRTYNNNVYLSMQGDQIAFSNALTRNASWQLVTIVGYRNGMVGHGTDGARICKLYVNGEADFDVDGTTANDDTTAKPFSIQRIGAYATETANHEPWNGGLANIKIYKRALTQWEIVNEYRRYAVDFPSHGNYINIKDKIKRYKFFGNKVCTVLGLPENTWFYASEDYNLAVTSSEQTHFDGKVVADTLTTTHQLSIANTGNFGSDIPFRIKKNATSDTGSSDRWIKFTHWPDTAGSLPQHDLIFGYNNIQDRYRLAQHDGIRFDVKASEVTTSRILMVDDPVDGGDPVVYMRGGSNQGRLDVATIGNFALAEGHSIHGGSYYDAGITGFPKKGLQLATEGVIIGCTDKDDDTLTGENLYGGGLLVISSSKLDGTPTLMFENPSSNHNNNEAGAKARASIRLNGVDSYYMKPGMLQILGHNTGVGSVTGNTDIFLGVTSNSTTHSPLSTAAWGLMIDNTNYRVGIMNNSPSYTLDVTGTIRASGDIHAQGDIDGDNYTKIKDIALIETKEVVADMYNDPDVKMALSGSDNEINFHAGSQWNLLKLSSAGVVINDKSQAGYDFRVETDSNTHMLFTDAGNNSIGINTDAPSAGNFHVKLPTKIDTTWPQLKLTQDGNPVWNLGVSGAHMYIKSSNDTSDLIIRNNSDSNLVYLDFGALNFGINTNAPTATFQYRDGDTGKFATTKVANHHEEWTHMFGGGSTTGYDSVGNADTWLKMCHIDLDSNDSYTGISFQVDITDVNSNWGHRPNPKVMRYMVAIQRESSAGVFPNRAWVSGPSTEYLRVCKVDNTNYELQVRQPANWCNIKVNAKILETNSGVVTWASGNGDGSTGLVPGSTTGTFYDGSNDEFTSWNEDHHAMFAPYISTGVARDFDDMNSGKQEVAFKTFTGTTGDVNTNTTVAHGISDGKKRIVSVVINVVCSGDPSGNIPANAFMCGGGGIQDELSEGRQFQSYYDDTNVYLHIDSNATEMDGNRYTMLVTYTRADLY
tara:strand:- start:551 stop:4246 length:3696 start_codon:yes stop_codon:yes gene_type:complete